MLNFAAASEILLCAGASVSTFYLSWQQSRSDRWLTILPKDDNDDARRLQSLYGYNEHSFLGVSVQKHVWTGANLDGAVSYTERGDVWVIAGEPLGSEEHLPAITREFMQFARSKRKIVAFLPTTEKFARCASEHDVNIVKIGASPYFDLQNWNPRGNSAKKLRLGVNHGRKAGISVEQVYEINEGFRQEVTDLCESWIGTRRAGIKFGWLFELMPFQNAESKKFFAARDSEGNLVGLLAASPIPAREGWYLEDVLRSADAPNGTADLLVFEALHILAGEGAKLATLGTVPLSENGDDEVSSSGNFIARRAMDLSRSKLNSLYNFEGLRCFKSKFVPSWWESEYVIVSKGVLVSPRVTNAILKTIMPGGALRILQFLLTVQKS